MGLYFTVQLRLGLARAVTLGQKSRRTHGHILLSHLRVPQPGGPGPHIYIPQEQGGTVTPLGTGFPFCRLLRLSGILTRLHTGESSNVLFAIFVPVSDEGRVAA
jgi:hypothetical protein